MNEGKVTSQHKSMNVAHNENTLLPSGSSHSHCGTIPGLSSNLLFAAASRGATATWCVEQTPSARPPPAAPTLTWRSAV